MLEHKNQKKYMRLLELCMVGVVYIIAMFVYYHNNIIAGLIVILMSIVVFISNVKKNKTILDLYTLFLSSWLFTFGLSMLRLLRYQLEWEPYFFLLNLLGIISIAFGLSIGKLIKSSNVESRINPQKSFAIVVICSLISVVMFILTYNSTGVIPLLSDLTTSYRDFYTRYYLIMSGMLPSAGLAFYLLKKSKLNIFKRTILAAAILLHLVILPTLFVQRGTFVIGIFFVLPLIYYYTVNKKRLIRSGLVIFIILLVVITSARNYSDEQVRYLFKPGHTLSQISSAKYFNELVMIYGYLTISHDNFSYNIDKLNDYGYGAFRVKPFEVIIRTDKFEEIRNNTALQNISFGLNSHNMLAMYYYDFGAAGVFFFSLIYGAIFGYIEKGFKKIANPINTMAYGGALIVFSVGFFADWTMQFTLWMWLGMAFIFWLINPKIKKTHYL